MYLFSLLVIESIASVEFRGPCKWLYERFPKRPFWKNFWVSTNAINNKQQSKAQGLLFAIAEIQLVNQ